MSSSNIQKYLLNNKKSQFVNKNFVDFKQDLLNYAKEFYSDNIVDFSETSLGGMFLDFASIVGDSLVFYAEQQFAELDYETATNIQNIEKHLKRANIKNNSAYPSSVTATFSITVLRDSNSKQDDPKPVSDYLPVIKKGLRLISDSGIEFTLTEDVDFSSDYTQEIDQFNEDGSPYSLRLSKEGICNSGSLIVENVFFPADDPKQYFLSYQLEKSNVTEIISVTDSDLNEYYEVDYLSQNTIFESIYNEVDKNTYIHIKSAPRRFVVERNFSKKNVVLRFGNGDGKIIKDNVFANTSDLILPLKNKNVLGRTMVNPNLILKNNSFGVSPKGKNLTIVYKSGGGVSHNIRKETLKTFLETPSLTFSNSNTNIPVNVKESLLSSLSVINKEDAVGGASAPTINDLKANIPAAIKSQGRIINHEDLVARIITMPSNFGKIEKAVALDNPYSSLSKDLYIICKNNEGFYVNASDAIKINLSNYINEFRLISDSYNILDVPIYNFSINMTVRVAAGYNIQSVLSDIQRNIISELRFDLLQIGEPINVNRIVKAASNTRGLLTIVTPKENIIVSRTEKNQFFDYTNDVIRSYSNNSIDPLINYADGFVYPSRGGIFEMKYTSKDIVINAN